MSAKQIAVLLFSIVAAIGKSCAASAQTPAGFETASIRAGQVGERPVMTVTPGGVTYENVTLAECLEAAYALRAHQIAGPHWIHTERYSLVARTSAPIPVPQVPALLQSLLEERFALRSHWEQRQLQIYALRAGKGALRLTRDDGRDGVTPIPGGLTFRGVTMAEFTGQFLNSLPTMDRPIIDETQIDGRYTFSLQMFDRDSPPVDLKPAVAAGGPDLFIHALEQVGLELHRESRATPVLVIDAANRMPAED